MNKCKLRLNSKIQKILMMASMGVTENQHKKEKTKKKLAVRVLDQPVVLVQAIG
jgi:hypothetical protein